MEYQIFPLASYPHYSGAVAERTYRLWGRLIYEDTGMSASDFIQVVQSRAVTDRIPLTLIALAGDELAGMVSLKQHEAITDAALSPWIGGLLVEDAWRGKGLGAALLAQAEAAAIGLGHPVLYLSCEADVEHFYARLGWECMARKQSCGDEVAVMKKRLA